ncbi:MAG: nucleotide exchange factor GrpE [Bacteroidota bacterium]
MENENLEENEIQESADNQVEESKKEGNAEEEVGSNENGVSPKAEEEADTKSELEVLQDELSESKDKYLRLYSEFENFRRRTAKEKLEMVQTANESLISDLLSVIDDFERAEKSFEDNDSDIKALKEGLDLISGKFKKILEQKGLKTMEHKQGSDFDPEFHEAITQIPAPKKKLKGKIVDVIEKGYLLKDKVVRYAKVVIGS